MNQRIIGIDPGSEHSGLCILDDYNIIGAFNLQNDYALFDKVTTFSVHSKLTIVIEDLKPYTLRLTPQVIDTAKFIGICVDRLKNHAGLNIELISRYEVKRWVFDTFPEVCLPIIDKKNDKKVFDACDIKTKEIVRIDDKGRTKRKSSFISVDDKVVTECMKYYFNIKQPKARQRYEYGLQTHSWQALATALCFKKTKLNRAM